MNFVKLADTVFIHLVSWHLLDDLCCHALVVNVNPCQISSVKEKQLDKETKPFLASDQYLFLSFGFGVRYPKLRGALLSAAMRMRNGLLFYFNPSTSPLKSFFDSPQLSVSFNVQHGGRTVSQEYHRSHCKIRLICRLAFILI